MTAKESNDKSVIDGAGTRQQRYERLVNEFYNDIFRYAYWLSKSRPLAEDLTQETFMRAWRAFDSLQSPGAAKAWLFTILRRENARLYEKYRPELDDIDDHQSALQDTRHNEPDQQMEMELLHKAIAALESEYREPLILQVIGGFSGDEIASMLNLNNNTVMTRLFRARNKLRAVLDAGNNANAGSAMPGVASGEACQPEHVSSVARGEDLQQGEGLERKEGPAQQAGSLSQLKQKQDQQV